MLLKNTQNDKNIEGSTVVDGFSKGSFGGKYQAEKSKLIKIGDVIYKINGTNVLKFSYDEIIGLLRVSKRPLLVSFRRSNKES